MSRPSSDLVLGDVPSPPRIRLLGEGEAPAKGRAPFDAAWSPDADDVAVRLSLPPDLELDRVDALDLIAEQLPPPDTLRPGALVAVLPEARVGVGVVGRLLGRGTAHVPRALRCAALLARGYGALGATEERAGDVVWAFARA
jgi:hypothetical protein